MEPSKLVKMANEIARFFESDADPTRSSAGVADHLKRFWDPRMRRELLAWVDDHAGEGLRPTVLAALRDHRERLTPPPPR